MINWRNRLAIVSDEASESFAEAVEICLPLGIRAFELRRFGGARFPYVSDEAVDEVLSLVKAHNLTLVGVSPGFFKMAIDDPAVEAEFTEGFPRAFQLMDRLGVRRMAVFSYARTGDSETQIPSQVLAHLHRAHGLCQQAGVDLVIENGASCWGDTGANLAQIARTIGIRVTWDPANAAAAGEVAFPTGYTHVRDLLDYVHCKNWCADGGNVALDAGIVDWAGQLAALQADAYTGYFCVEPHQWQDRANATRLNTAQLLTLLEMI